MNPLEKARRKIDRIDGEILERLNERFRLALETCQYKMSLQDRKREAEVLGRIRERAAELDCLREDFAAVLYRMIIRESLFLQARQKQRNISSHSLQEVTK